MKNIKLKLKEEKGFTMQDIIVASVIILVFVGAVIMLMTAIYKNNIKTKLNSQMTVSSRILQIAKKSKKV